MILKLSTFVTACYLAGFTLLTPVAATPSLSLSITGPTTVDNVNDVNVVTTLTNTGDETLKLVNSVDGILSTKPGDAFTVTDADGVNVPYTGSSISDTDSSEEEYTILAPGESSEVFHDLSSLYGFSASGPGAHAYTIEAHQDFVHLDEQGGVVFLHATCGPEHVISIFDSQAKSVDPRAPQATFIGCTIERQRRIVTVVDEVKRLVVAAHQLAAVPGNFFSQRFVTWYGAFSRSRSLDVLQNWERIAAANFDPWVYDCGTCTVGNLGSLRGNTSRYGEVALCPGFWNGNNITFQTDAIIARLVTFDSIAGTQFISNYSQQSTKDLAIRNPDQAIQDTYAYVFFSQL